MAATIKMYAKQCDKAIMDMAFRGLLAGGEHLRNELVRTVSKSSRGMKMSGRGISPKRGGKPPIKLWHSKPGEPPRANTGKLRQSFYMRGNRSRLEVRIGTRMMHGIYMEKGTKGPYMIRAKRKKTLAFGGWVMKKAEAGGKAGVHGPKLRKGLGERMEWGWVFPKKVTHPGVKPRPFFRSTIIRNQSRITAIIARAVGGGGYRIGFGG